MNLFIVLEAYLFVSFWNIYLDRLFFTRSLTFILVSFRLKRAYLVDESNMSLMVSMEWLLKLETLDHQSSLEKWKQANLISENNRGHMDYIVAPVLDWFQGTLSPSQIYQEYHSNTSPTLLLQELKHYLTCFFIYDLYMYAAHFLLFFCYSVWPTIVCQHIMVML